MPIRFNDQVQQIRQGGEQPVDPMCNGFVAVNKGNCVVTVNNMPLQPPPGAGLSGESYGIIGHEGELYTRKSIKIVFSPGSNPLVVISQKIYDRAEWELFNKKNS
jgi:hypothetical protein